MSFVAPEKTRAALPWRFNSSYRALDYEFRVRTNSVELGSAVERLLSSFRIDSANGVSNYTINENRRGHARFVVYGRGRCLHRAASAAGALDFVLWDVHTNAIQGARQHLVLHAAAASWSGRGLLLPAPPDSGKTTLVAGLTRAGFAYLTDEAALIDPNTGRLHPFPRALWMDSQSVEAIPNLRAELPPTLLRLGGRTYHVPPDVLTPGGIGEPCTVRFVVAPSYHPGSSTMLVKISKAAAVLLLAQNCFNFERFGADGLAIVTKVIRDARCYRLRIGELSSAVAVIQRLVGSRNGNGRN